VPEGTFEPSESAADITAAQTGKATPEYLASDAFVDRTYITDPVGTPQLWCHSWKLESAGQKLHRLADVKHGAAVMARYE
jgi:hypothetical protein